MDMAYVTRRAGTGVSVVATIAFAASLGSALMNAQAPAAAKTVWDAPPMYTEEQASRGSQVFGSTCANCHTLGSQGNRPLSGEKFIGRYTQKTVGDLFAFMQKNMPNGNGGTLSENTYSDLLALILKSNGLPAGTAELTPAAVAAVQIMPKDGPGLLPAGTLVRVVGCLTKPGADFVLTTATAWERTEKTGTTPADATRALGEQTVALKFLMTKLDAQIGKRMSVTGLLIGAGGADGINVSTVTRVAETCP
jgi:mono/diheme cytochrome c family protein